MKNSLPNIISFLFILLFLYSGLDKLLSYQYFNFMLQRSPLTGRIGLVIALALPVLELSIGICLLLSYLSSRTPLRTKGLYAAGILMMLFTLYVAYMLAFAPSRPCSCQGLFQQMNWHQQLYFNITFTNLAILGIWLSKPSKTFS